MTKLPRRTPITVACGRSTIINAYDVNGDEVEYEVIAQPGGSGGPSGGPLGGQTGVTGGDLPVDLQGGQPSGGLYQTKPGSGTTASIMVMSGDSPAGGWGEGDLSDVDVLFQAGVLSDLARGTRTQAIVFDAASVRPGQGGRVTLDLPAEIDMSTGADLTFLVIDKS